VGAWHAAAFACGNHSMHRIRMATHGQRPIGFAVECLRRALYPTSNRGIRVEQILSTIGVAVKEQIVLGDRDAVKAAVNAGFGVSIMSKWPVERDSDSRLPVLCRF
jgi:DNA-binding transcriptional LysR family regulator